MIGVGTTARPGRQARDKAPGGIAKLHLGRAVCLLIGISLLGCAAPTALSPTSTPTRTPVLPTATATPTLTPTPTPTATPTLPPVLVLAPTPEMLGHWVRLPSDLYYLQDGRISHWLTEGGVNKELPAAQEAESNAILEYRLSASGRMLLYVTDQQQLYVMDRATWTHESIPTSGKLLGRTGAYFELSPDDRYLLYLAWGVTSAAEATPAAGTEPEPEDGQAVGTIRMVDRLSPRSPESEIAVCYASDQVDCAGFVLAPDGARIAVHDSRGVQIVSLPQGEQVISVELPEAARVEALAWSNDGTHLVVTLLSAGGNSLAVIDGETGFAIDLVPLYAMCNGTCELEATWTDDTVWSVYPQAPGGCIARGPLVAGDDSQWPDTQVCELEGRPFDPAHPHPTAAGGLAFLQRDCGGACPDPPSGIYFMDPTGEVTPIALLDPEFARTAQVIWSPGAAAFLVLDTDGVPRYLGIAAGDGFWDLQDALVGARSIRWEPSTTD